MTHYPRLPAKECLRFNFLFIHSISCQQLRQQVGEEMQAVGDANTGELSKEDLFA
jgi:hypothetical protein